MYTLDAFSSGDTYHELLDRIPSQDIGTGGYQNSPTPLSFGGFFDGLGSDEAYKLGGELDKTLTIWFATESERLVYFRTLRALTGRQGRLYRRWEDDEIEWVTARLVEVSAERELEHQRHLEVDVRFQIYSAFWHGDLNGNWLFDSGEFFDSGLNFDASSTSTTIDSSPKSFTITNDGNAIVNNPTITVTAGGANITALEIKCTTTGNLWELDYSATITSAQALVIDCGAFTVLNNAVDDEANFSLGTTHAIDEWARLMSGSNAITVTITGGDVDSTVEFTFYDGYK